VLAPDARPDLKEWWSPKVGWGIILPPSEKRMSAADLSAARDAPEVVQRLIAKRFSAPGVPREREATRAAVLRPVAGADQVMFLSRDGTALDIAGAPMGMADDAIPMYLLLCGTPKQLSWELQYVLGKRRLVGRLDLSEEGLTRYVDALLSDWDGKANSPRNTTVWSVVDEEDEDDEEGITRIMRDLIAAPLAAAMSADKDGDIDVTFIDGTQNAATWATLTSSLASTKPGVIVTTSHGVASRNADTLGLPIDQEGRTADPSALLNGKWAPNGAVWYAHACCSAGSTGRSIYAGLFAAGTENGEMLADVAAAGPSVAPLPTALLSAPKPLRAFIGHVEPTFNYSLREPATGQSLTANLVAAIYPNLMRPEPVGHALLDWQGQSSTYHAQYAHSQARFDRGEPNAEEALLYYALCASDVGSMVILGDPAATLPPLR
jgi:hypothetical protein